MCGRTACARSSKEIELACSYQSKAGNELVQPEWINSNSSHYKPSYNKGPKSSSAVLLHNCDSVTKLINEISTIRERILFPMQWGLVPSWHKGSPKKFAFNMINCRLDTLTSKKSFMRILEKGQRCVILADGFYEWQTTSTKKQPYYIHLKDDIVPHPATNKKQMLTMAGLFDKHTSEEEGEIYTYTIITVDASDTFKVLHNRMPAILITPDAVDKWLDSASVSWENALKLLSPSDCLQWYPVSTFINNVRNDSPECLERVNEKEKVQKFGSCKLMHAWLKIPAPKDSSTTSLQPLAKKRKIQKMP